MQTDPFQSWRPELRRAVMKTRPEFFTWPADQQERYRVSIPEEDRTPLEDALLVQLFGRVSASPERAAAAADSLTLDQQNRWNEVILPLHGIGEDRFYLNECFADGTSILSFESLRDFDEEDYRFQEQARQKDDATYVAKPYRGSLYLNWARLMVDGRFTYATLSMAAGYLYAELDIAANDLLQQRIPHSYVPGKNHGHVDGDQWEWDMRVDANGQEGVLEELQLRVWRYEQARYDALRTKHDDASRAAVYLIDKSDPPDQNVHFVFSDKRALEAIRFRTFLRDCRAMERPHAELQQEVEVERAALASFIETQHAEILRTHDPKVAPFRQRRKVMVLNGAFE